MTGHAHSRAAYIAGHRDCPGCRDANAAYQRSRTRNKAYGRPTNDMVDSGPVREHLATLAEAGIGWRRIAALAGVAESVVARLVGHAHDKPARQVRPATAAALLAVTPDALAPGALVDAAPAWRLVHGMAARGYSMAWIGSQVTGHPVAGLQLGRERCTREALDRLRVAAEYAAIHPGPSERARRRAAREGWDAAWLWPDPSVDTEPVAVDEVDEVAVARLVAGEQVDATEAELVAAGRQLVASGLAVSTAARRLRLSRSTEARLAGAA